MQENRRRGVLVAAMIWIALLGLGAAAYKFIVAPRLKGAVVEETGSASQYRHTVRVRADAFSGYAIFRSTAMKNLLKGHGIKLEIDDDKADYAARIRALQDGSTDLAVFTIDADLKAGAELGAFPGTIVMVIDETVGGDAMVAYKDGVPTLQNLDHPGARIVATPNSPSEFLARTVIATLSLPSLRNDWLVGADGAGEVWKRFKRAQGEERRWAYVLWEPYVSKALQEPRAHVLLDSGKMRGYIVDVLLARREFLREHPELVRTVVESYFRALYSYSERPGGMEELVREDAAALGETLSEEDARRTVRGIAWKNTLENYAHFGIVSGGEAGGLEYLEDIIAKIADVWVKTGALRGNPVEGRAHTLFYKGMLTELQAANFHPGRGQVVIDGVGPGAKDLPSVRKAAELPPLPPDGWRKLMPVGAMRLEPIGFRRGTSEISEFSRAELDRLATRVNSWPSYYVRVVGNSRPEGDPEANRLLAESRARAVLEHLVSRGVAANRLRAEVAPGGDASEGRSEVSFVFGQVPY